MPQPPSTDRDTPQGGTGAYDVTTEIFIAVMLTIMGALVLVTPLVSEMPRDRSVDPVLLDVVIGLLYLVIGGGVFWRARRKRAAAPPAAERGGPTRSEP